MATSDTKMTTDMELAEEIERKAAIGDGHVALTNEKWQQIIAALRRADLAQTEIKGHMRVEDDLQGRIAELEEMLSMACAVAEAGFDTDYGFNYEASIEPRRIVAKIREALKSRA